MSHLPAVCWDYGHVPPHLICTSARHGTQGFTHCKRSLYLYPGYRFFFMRQGLTMQRHVALCNSGCPGTHCIDWAGLKLDCFKAQQRFIKEKRERTPKSWGAGSYKGGVLPPTFLSGSDIRCQAPWNLNSISPLPFAV